MFLLINLHSLLLYIVEPAIGSLCVQYKQGVFFRQHSDIFIVWLNHHAFRVIPLDMKHAFFHEQFA